MCTAHLPEIAPKLRGQRAQGHMKLRHGSAEVSCTGAEEVGTNATLGLHQCERLSLDFCTRAPHDLSNLLPPLWVYLGDLAPLCHSVLGSQTQKVFEAILCLDLVRFSWGWCRWGWDEFSFFGALWMSSQCLFFLLGWGGGNSVFSAHFLTVAVDCASFFGHGETKQRNYKKGSFAPIPTPPTALETF